MIRAIVNWLMPDSLWTWIALAVLALIIAAAWLVPKLTLSSRVLITAGALVLALIGSLYSLWQGAEADAATWKSNAEIAQTNFKLLEKRNTILDREARQKLAEDTRIDTATIELKDAINEAAKQTPPGAVTDPAARAVGCARLRRGGQTGSADYRRLCG